MGGGAVTAIDSRVFMLEALTSVYEVVIDAEPYTSLTEAWAESAAAQDTWVNISGSTFTGNSSEGGGGAVLALGNTAVSNSTFTNNSSSGDDLFEASGGALAIVGGLSLTQSRFVGNIAQWGGAIELRELFSNSSVSVLTRNTFIRNIAITHGGAIAGWTAEGSARGNRFTRNRAPVGSAVSATTETCSRSWSRREVRKWKGNTFRRNSGGRLPVQCYVFVAPEPS
jgi:predicted outer membrane repeat protein